MAFGYAPGLVAFRMEKSNEAKRANVSSLVASTSALHALHFSKHLSVCFSVHSVLLYEDSALSSVCSMTIIALQDSDCHDTVEPTFIRPSMA